MSVNHSVNNPAPLQAFEGGDESQVEKTKALEKKNRVVIETVRDRLGPSYVCLLDAAIAFNEIPDEMDFFLNSIKKRLDVFKDKRTLREKKGTGVKRGPRKI